MARKTRARSRHKARKGKGRHVGLFAGAFARSGWGRFAVGILIGLALGVGGALYLGGFDLGTKGVAKVTTLNASPVQKATQKTAEAPAKPQPAPQVVEPAPVPPHEKPLGEEAKVAVQAAKPPAPMPAPDSQVATIAPPVNDAADAACAGQVVDGNPEMQREILQERIARRLAGPPPVHRGQLRRDQPRS